MTSLLFAATLVLLAAMAAALRARQATARADQACARAAADLLLEQADRARIAQRQSGHDAQEHAIQGLLAIVFLMVDTPVLITTVQAGEAGRTLMTNPSLDRLLGYRSGMLTGRMALDAVSAPDRRRVAAAMAEQDLRGRSFTMDIALLDKSAQEVATKLTCVLPAEPELRRFRIMTLRRRAEAGRLPKAAPVAQIVAGKIRLSSLAGVRPLLGDEWDAVAARIMAVARAVIQAHVGAQDTVRATPDLGYVITFAGMMEAEAGARCGAIGREIRRALIQAGEDATSVEVMSDVIRLPAPADDLALDAGFAVHEIPAIRRPARSQECSFESVQSCRRGEFVGWFLTFNGVPPGGSGPATVTGPLKPGLAPSLAEKRAYVLKAAARQAHEAECQQSTEMLFIEIDFACFASRAGEDTLMETFARLDPEARARMVLLLGGIPASVPNSRLWDVTTRLSPLGFAVGFSLASLDPPGFDLSVFKAPLVSVDAGGWGDPLPEARVGRLVQSLHLRRARLLVRRPASILVARQLRGMGVDLVSSGVETGTAAS